MSMKPGATAQSEASSTRSPCRRLPISTMTPPSIAMSATRPAPPVPSKTVPPRITSSATIDSPRSVDHELQEVAVGVAHVHAVGTRTPTALALDRTFDDLGARGFEQHPQPFRRGAPFETEVATRWYCGGGAQGEAFARPD